MSSACRRWVEISFLAPTVGLMVVSAAVRAQGVTGAAIHGRVVAPDNVPVAEATVLVTNTSNGERWRTTTTSGGDYQVDYLSLGGRYRIEVRAIGLQPERREGVVLSLGQRHRVDFALRPGVAILEPIMVHTADDPLINAGRTGPTQTISESTLARLPIADRTLLSVASLSPLVTGNGSVAGRTTGSRPCRLTAPPVAISSAA